MKRFLTVLLVIAVMFTFSFGTSFAADYTVDDFNSALKAEKTTQMGFIKTAVEKGIKEIAFDSTTGLYDNYSKAAYQAAADKMVAGLEATIDANITKALNATTELPTTAPTAQQITDIVIGTNTPIITGITALPAGFDASSYYSVSALKGVKVSDEVGADSVVATTQEPITKASYEEKIAKIDLAKYNAETAKYKINSSDAIVSGDELTAAEAAKYVVDRAKTAIATAAADKTKTADEKLTAYKNAYDALVGSGALADIVTLEDEAITESENNKDNTNATTEFIAELAQAVGTPIPEVTNASNFTTGLNLGTCTNAAGIAKFTVDGTGNKATVFGVAVADKTKVTRAEAIAINDAAYAMINEAETAAVAKAYITKAGSKPAAKYETLKKIQAAKKLYADVVALGEKYKNTTEYGVKTYNDTNVDAAVEAAKKLVYEEFMSPSNTGDTAAADYIDDAATALKISIYAAARPIFKFQDAIEKMIAKMYSDASAPYSTKTTATLIGVNKTPDADLVYLAGTYATIAQDAWEDIADDAVEALLVAQSYDELDSIMADAAAKFSKLMLSTDEKAVKDAIDKYAGKVDWTADPITFDVDGAIDAYMAQVQALNTATVASGTWSDALADAKALIATATTVDGVKEAYAEAQKIIDSVKSNDELAAMKKAVADKINALPILSEIKADDKDAVMDAYNAFVEYANVPGNDATSMSEKAMLQKKVQAVIDAEAKDLEAASEETAKKIKALLPAVSDADQAALAALNSDAQAIAKAVADINDEVSAINEDAVMDAVNANALNTTNEYAKYVANAAAIGGTIYEAQIADAKKKLVAAGKDGATDEQVKAAMDAYNALTEAQQMDLLSDNFEYYMGIIKNAEVKAEEPAFDAEAVKAALQDMSVVARSTKLSSGKIKVTVKADTQALIDAGYTVTYKFFTSTKKSSGYKSKIEKATKSFTTSGVKGKTNYWKVTVKVKDADGNLVAKTPLTQCRYACRTL